MSRARLRVFYMHSTNGLLTPGGATCCAEAEQTLAFAELRKRGAVLPGGAATSGPSSDTSVRRYNHGRLQLDDSRWCSPNMETLVRLSQEEFCVTAREKVMREKAHERAQPHCGRHAKGRYKPSPSALASAPCTLNAL